MAGIGGALGWASLRKGQALRRVREHGPYGRSSLRRGRAIRGWQDSCAVHDLGASDGEKPLWWQDVRVVYSPTALCGAFRMHATHILPKLAESEYMAAIYCHELAVFPSEALS